MNANQVKKLRRLHVSLVEGNNVKSMYRWLGGRLVRDLRAEKPLHLSIPLAKRRGIFVVVRPVQILAVSLGKVDTNPTKTLSRLHGLNIERAQRQSHAPIS